MRAQSIARIKPPVVFDNLQFRIGRSVGMGFGKGKIGRIHLLFYDQRLIARKQSDPFQPVA